MEDAPVVAHLDHATVSAEDRPDVHNVDAFDGAVDRDDPPDAVVDRLDRTEVVEDAQPRCETSEWIIPGHEVRGVLGPSSPRARWTCTPETVAVRYLRVVVPPQRLLTLSITSQSTGAEPARLQLIDDCDGACLAGSDTVRLWRHEGSADRVLVVAVYRAGPLAADLEFILRSTLGPVEAATGCLAATPLSLPARVNISTPPRIPPTNPTCGVTVPATWYRVSVPAGRVLTVAGARRYEADLFAADSCGAASCQRASGVELRVPATTVARELLVGVLSSVSSAEVSFDTLPATTAPAPTCEAPADLALPATLDGPIFESGEVPVYGTCAGAGPFARFYRVEIPPRSTLIVESLNAAATVAHATFCNLWYCWNSAGGPRYVMTNPSQAPRVETFAVVRRSLGVLSSVSVRFRAVPLPPERGCDTAPPLPASGEVPLTPREGNRIFEGAIECGGAGRIEVTHFYRVDVPPQTALRAVVTNNWRVAFLSRCGASECMGAATYYAPVSARWANASDTPAQVVVAASDSGLPGTLRVERVAIDPSMRCETSRFLSETPQATSTRYGIDLRVCWSSLEFSRPATWWRLGVPVGQQARIVVEGPRSSTQAFLNISRACGAFNCVPASTFATSERAESVVINDGPGDTLYVQLVADEETRRISATLEDPPPHRRCASATALTVGVALPVERLPATGDPAPACEPLQQRGGAAFYRVEVPPRSRLRVSVRAALPVALRQFAECGAPSCTAGSTTSTTATLTLTNATDAPSWRFVAVSAAEYTRELSRERFSIEATQEPVPDGGG